MTTRLTPTTSLSHAPRWWIPLSYSLPVSTLVAVREDDNYDTAPANIMKWASMDKCEMSVTEKLGAGQAYPAYATANIGR